MNLDEEAADMLKFEQLYQAAASMMSVADTLFQTLLQSLAQVTNASQQRHPAIGVSRGARRCAARESSTRSTRCRPGLRINSPSDDPVAAARVAHLDASLTRLDQYQANAIFARNQLGLEEESLSEAIDNLQRIRELTLQANNGTASAGDRQVIAAEIRQHRDALLAIANTTDVDGRHLFGGYREAATPFTTTAGGSVVYNGDQGQRTLQISDSRFVAINDSGVRRVPANSRRVTARSRSASNRRQHRHGNARLEQRRRILRPGSPTPTPLQFLTPTTL